MINAANLGWKELFNKFLCEELSSAGMLPERSRAFSAGQQGRVISAGRCPQARNDNAPLALENRVIVER